jgi:aspartyl-tRNA(Asn)/glutamyl-tRNA(Gln) amidotransferase subunit C
MIIDEKTIKHLEDLSNMNLEDSEREELMKDLNKIIDYVGNIKNMEIEDEGMYTPIESYVELRKDEVKESVSDREIINKNFPENSKNGVKVPPIK